MSWCKGKSSHNCFGSFFFVLIVGLLLTAFGLAIGIAFTVRIPFTKANISAGGSIGRKEMVRQVFPNYLESRVASNSDFINHTSTLTVWKAEGIGIVVIGNQLNAPWIDIDLNLKK